MYIPLVIPLGQIRKKNCYTKKNFTVELCFNHNRTQPQIIFLNSENLNKILSFFANDSLK